jgi:hypothetical protein
MKLGPLRGRSDTRCTVPCRPQPLRLHTAGCTLNASPSVHPHVTAPRNECVTLFQRVTSCGTVGTDVLNKCAGRLPSRWKQQVRLKRRCMSTKTARYYIPEGSVRSHCHRNQKSHKEELIWQQHGYFVNTRRTAVLS